MKKDYHNVIENFAEGILVASVTDEKVLFINKELSRFIDYDENIKSFGSPGGRNTFLCTCDKNKPSSDRICLCGIGTSIGLDKKIFKKYNEQST